MRQTRGTRGSGHTGSLVGSVGSEGKRGGDVMVRMRGKHGVYRTTQGDVNRTLDEAEATELRKRELRKANERLKKLEQLEKYKEEKMRRQYELIEEQKRREEEEHLQRKKKEEARRKHIAR